MTQDAHEVADEDRIAAARAAGCTFQRLLQQTVPALLTGPSEELRDAAEPRTTRVADLLASDGHVFVLPHRVAARTGCGRGGVRVIGRNAPRDSFRAGAGDEGLCGLGQDGLRGVGRL